MTSAAIFPDRRRIVTGSVLDNTLRVWLVGPEDRCCVEYNGGAPWRGMGIGSIAGRGVDSKR